MTYGQGQYLEIGKRYTASFTNGVGAIVAGNLPQYDIDTYAKGIPWIANSAWLEPSGTPYADWTFTCAMAIDAQALGVSLAQVLSTFDPLSGWDFAQMADAGQGLATQNQGTDCSLDNLGACFSQGKSILIWGAVALLAIVFLSSGGPSLLRGVTGK